MKEIPSKQARKKIKEKRKQVILYLSDEEIKYIDFIYNKKYYPTRASYIRMLINEDKELNGY